MTSRAVDTAGTVRGTVRSPRGAAVDGRIVEIVNLDTGERQRLTTNIAGTFSLRVKPGKYRVELALRDGESLLQPPAVIDLNRMNLNRTATHGSLDAHVNLVVGTVRASRPRGPGYRTDHGLGSPIG